MRLAIPCLFLILLCLAAVPPALAQTNPSPHPAQRVATDGGLANSGTVAADPSFTAVEEATWRLVTINVDDWQVQTLQPLAWIESSGLVEGSSIDLALILDLQEMGVPEGLYGTVISIAACPEIADGPGRVVLTTVSHLNSDVYTLTLTDGAGESDAIGITGSHRVYTLDRGWVAARDLLLGEEVQTANGIATVAGLAAQNGSYRVYNLTVEADHVYYVGDLSALVHNNYSINQMNREIQRGLAPKGIIRVDKGKILGELDHVHFGDGSALNANGTWKHGGRILTGPMMDWLSKWGWTLP